MTAIPDEMASDPRQTIADLERKLDERTSERDEALERQIATAEILKIIANSPTNVQPVFEAIAESAKRLLAGHSAAVTRVVGDMIHLAAYTAGTEAGNKALVSSFPQALPSPGIHGRVASSGVLALFLSPALCRCADVPIAAVPSYFP
jgi:hypothetical protein